MCPPPPPPPYMNHDIPPMYLTNTIQGASFTHEDTTWLNETQQGTLKRSQLPGVPQKNFDCLIWRKLKTTVFTRPVFIFSKSSYFNLNFGIKQSKIV